MTIHSTASAAAKTALRPALLRGEDPCYSNALTIETFREELAPGVTLQGTTDGLTYGYRLTKVPECYRWQATATALEVELTYPHHVVVFTLPVVDLSQQEEGYRPLLKLHCAQDVTGTYAAGETLYSHHRQLTTSQGFTVDEGMAGLLSFLWQEGYSTAYSCEDNYGTSYVAFSTLRQAERFSKAYQKAHPEDEHLVVNKLARGRAAVRFSSAYPKTFPRPSTGFTAEGERVILTT